ncbi:hypothetical protein AC249_AIPGENE12564 [Exaiptasia diaphana]|nr:hypothetical protein AC249_AIPGENE12564 [Exaiptasia diaphana]
MQCTLGKNGILLYGCETWKINKEDEKKLNTFQSKCLRYISKIRWWEKVTNDDKVREMAEVDKLSNEIRRRRWNWIGHILRGESESDCLIALEWTPEGRRARERPKTTWRTTVLKERDNEGWKTWNETKMAARDRDGWKEGVKALCAYWQEIEMDGKRG